MADVKWIKITTDIFDDEKIILIESLPDAYAIITVWFKLLCLAGKQNNSGVFLMGRIPYTDKMLATIFRMKESTVTMALQTFENFGMVELVDGVITIPNWNKHQSLDAYEKKKQRDRLYQAERRAAQKAIAEKSSDTSSYVAVSDKEEDKDKDKDIEIDSISAAPTRAPKPKKHKKGEYGHVLLTEEQEDKLIAEYGEIVTAKAIVFLDEYIEMKGYKAKNHYLVIRKWVVDAVKEREPKQGSFDTDDFMAAAIKKSLTAADDPTIRERADALKGELAQWVNGM
jgi:predicted phage replisome organizer